MEWKTYSTKSAMNKAIIKAGFGFIPYRTERPRDDSQIKRWQPVFIHESERDREYIRSKGFKAVPPPRASLQQSGEE